MGKYFKYVIKIVTSDKQTYLHFNQHFSNLSSQRTDVGIGSTLVLDASTGNYVIHYK